ncbi:MAG: hypothetical protein V4649_19505 [Bacteroidota bacterium]
MTDQPVTKAAIDANKVTQAYVALRDKRSEIKQAYEAEDAVIRDKMDRLEAWLMTTLRAIGADSLKTEHGTAFISTRDRASCADWGTLWAWMAENGRLDMLEKRVSTKPIVEYLEQYGELPPGVSINREQTIVVRR